MSGLLSGVLPAVYGASNKLKRSVNTLLADPREWLERVQQDVEGSQRQILDLQATAYPLPGQRSVLVGSEQQGEARNELAQWGANMGLLGMAIDPRAQKRLVEGLLGAGNAERYRLGDLKPAQVNQLLQYTSVKPRTNDVYVSPSRELHVKEGRLLNDGFGAAETGVYAKQAMRPDSGVVGPLKPGDYPALYSQRMNDPVTGEGYNAMMPLMATDEGFEMVTVIPKGLQKRKTPKR